MKKRNIQEKTYYILEQGGFGVVKDTNVGDFLIISEDIDDINWYMENVLHVKSEGVYVLDNHTKQEADFFMRLSGDKYYVMKATLMFGHGQHSKLLPDEIKNRWEKIREHYVTGAVN